VQMLDRLESEILADRVSEESRRWLASCGLTVEQMQNQMDPVYTPARKIHLYHCDHRGLPLALVSTEGSRLGENPRAVCGDGISGICQKTASGREGLRFSRHWLW
ncbi:RHS domain-containing protein, partial [Enterobacter hormaechei subsp. hoffmannii]